MSDKPYATGGFVPGPGSPDAPPPIELTGCDFGAVTANVAERAKAASDGQPLRLLTASPFDFAGAVLSIGPDGPDIPVTDVELDATWNLPPGPVLAERLPEVNFTFRAEGIDKFIEVMSQIAASLMRFAEPCSSRPAPFPAARDYRRRTKHRNRRRR
jgi:hypothetical protein